jgi:predicted enzyme related to lactoylglutathione lyase
VEVLASRLLLRPVDPERSWAFYGTILRLAVAREFPGGVVYHLGGGFLEVSGRAEAPAGPTVQLWLSVRDVDRTWAEATAAGAVGLRSPEDEPWGLREGWLEGPDGERLCLVTVPPEHPMRRDTR